MLRPIVTKKRMLQILTRSSGNDRASRICDKFLSTMILLNLFAVSMESVSSPAKAKSTEPTPPPAYMNAMAMSHSEGKAQLLAVM